MPGRHSVPHHVCKFCHQASTVHIQKLTVIPAEIKVTEPTRSNQSESDVKESVYVADFHTVSTVPCNCAGFFNIP